MANQGLTEVVQNKMIYKCLRDIPCIDGSVLQAGTVVYIRFIRVNPYSGEYSKRGVKYIELLDAVEFANFGYTSINEIRNSYIPCQINSTNFYLYFSSCDGLCSIYEREAAKYQKSQCSQQKLYKASIIIGDIENHMQVA